MITIPSASADPQRVTLVTLGVADLDRARRFYAALGWRPAEETPGVSFYQMHGAVLALFGLADLAKDQGRDGAPLGTGAATLAQNFASEAEVDAAFALALSAGAKALKAPEKVFWGGYSGYYADPDGHVWELAVNPFWPLAADGSLTLPGQTETIAEQDLPAADEAQIAALMARCFDTAFDGRSFYQTRHHWRHVSRADGRIIAHMGLQLRAIRLGGVLMTVAAMGEVATDPDHRGQGHAGRLLQAAIRSASEARAAHLILFGTAGLYAAAGFRPAANPMRWVEMTGAVTGGLAAGPAKDLMVLPLGAAPWDEAAGLDLLGPTF